jgi:flagellar hook-associated protein 3 FlgL
MIGQTAEMIYRLGNLDIQQQRLSYQSSTGKLLQNGSDDSVLYSREIFVDDKIRTFEGLKTQVQRTAAQNNVADSSMSEIKNILDYIKAELIKANTATTTEDGLKAIAVNLAGMKENLYDLANTQVEGEYVFAGSDSSVKPFEKDSDGNVTYVGNNKLRRIAVEEGSYRERGVKLNSPTNDTLTKYDLDGNIALDSSGNVISSAVSNDGLTPATYSFSAPLTDGTRFEAKSNIFHLIDDVVNSLNKVDSLGNPISLDIARSEIGESLGKMEKAYDAVNTTHAELGGRNRVFEVSLEKISSKVTHYNILSQSIGAADLSKVAMESKALELTYTALYSTINRTNQLSLVNFLN